MYKETEDVCVPNLKKETKRESGKWIPNDEMFEILYYNQFCLYSLLHHLLFMFILINDVIDSILLQEPRRWQPYIIIKYIKYCSRMIRGETRKRN